MYFLMALQICCWCLLAFFLTLLIPIVVPVLFNGMLIWNDATIIFCFLIEYAMAILLIELREHLVRRAKRWLPKLSRKLVRWLLLGSNILSYGLGLFMCGKLFAYITEWNFFVVMQWVALAVLIWALCGVAIPMSATKFWEWFRRPQELKEEWELIIETK